MNRKARTTNSFEALADRLASDKTNVSVSVGGGLAGLLGAPSGGVSRQTSVTDHTQLRVGAVSEVFNQSVFQASQLTHAERSVVVSTFEEGEVANVTARTIQNRIVAPNIPPDWHSIDDLGWLPPEVQKQIQDTLRLLPKVGQVVERPRPISLPTDGTVYDPELAHCCSCEPERAAAIAIRLEKQKAEALKECLEAQQLQLEIERRKLLLQRGELGPFNALARSLPAAGTNLLGPGDSGGSV